MKLLFAVDKNWSIGVDGHLLFHISNDLKRFKQLTSPGIIFMGRKTMDSLPGSKPLPDRENIVITSNKDYKKPGAHVVHSLDEAFDLIDELNPNGDLSVYCIGGGHLAGQILDRCEGASITKVNETFEDYDTSLTNLDELDNWKVVWESGVMKDGDLEYKYVDYKNLDFDK